MAIFTITRLSDGLTKTCTSARIAVAAGFCLAGRSQEVVEENFNESTSDIHRNLLDGEEVEIKGPNKTLVFLRCHERGAQDATVFMSDEYGIMPQRTSAPFRSIPDKSEKRKQAA